MPSDKKDQIIVVDKPAGVTSHDVVVEYRKKLGIKKIGHAGTLDPFATGVLILLVGQATKRFDEFSKLDKEYQMTIELGWATDTGDPEGKIIKPDWRSIGNRKDSPLRLSKGQCRHKRQAKGESFIKKIVGEISKKKIKKVLNAFLGDYIQQVPAFSAVKFKGQPLYKYARRGVKVKLPKRQVTIKEIELLEFQKRYNDGMTEILFPSHPDPERACGEDVRLSSVEAPVESIEGEESPTGPENRRGSFVVSLLRMTGDKEIKKTTKVPLNPNRNDAVNRGQYPSIKIRVVCSSGTYMRSLAQDIGQRLGVPAVAVELRRTRVGQYKIK